MDIIDFIYSQARNLQNPLDYYHGIALSKDFALPDNILAFFPRWSEVAEHSHQRYVLVIPFDPVVYCVEQSRFELHKGHGLLLRPWQRHNHLVKGERQLCERLLITFELSTPQEYLPVSQVMEISEASWKDVRRFLELYKSGNPTEVAWQLQKLLRGLAATQKVVVQQELSLTTTRAITYILRHIEENIEICKIASKVNLSPSHLRMVFRKEMHISIGKYIHAQKAQKACHLLQNTKLSIQEIAEQCGYSSIYAFSHFFKNIFSVSPVAFRNNKNN